MKTYTTGELTTILEEHRRLSTGDGGKQANLRGADLQCADLQEANLQDANLRWADLRGANLQDANLRGADLRGADLQDANLRGANLRGADLRGANLQDANLRDANLRGADLQDADLPSFQIPQDGTLTVWKKLSDGILCKLLVPEEAKRTATLIGRKCRCEFAKVLEVIGGNSGKSSHDQKTLYVPGEIVKPDSYDPDIRVECSHGIHFFLTREEAERY